MFCEVVKIEHYPENGRQPRPSLFSVKAKIELILKFI